MRQVFADGESRKIMAEELRTIGQAQLGDDADSRTSPAAHGQPVRIAVLRPVKLVSFVIVSLLLPIVSLSWAKEPSPEGEAAPIYNVMDLTVQNCEGPTIVASNAHPQRASIERSGLLPLGDLGYQVNFRRIPDFREWTAAIRLHDRSRTVDDSYVLFTWTGNGPFDAAYVITRLPEGIPGAEHAFQIVMQMQRESAGTGKTSFVRADTPFGQGLEMVVGGRVGSMCFPTSHFQYAQSAQTASIGISRFVVRGRDLIEYALVLAWPEGMAQADAIEHAQARMNTFQHGLEAVTH